ncbi:hypothetical protein OSSY52_02720 [Tepiditoga spiralis]|uniref:TIGR00725 family protein n=2 Tax=Tepiditoga spiralis TaxID=2108365 RepID=A0A7G1G1H5_9BACT|nr:TIGR00725 family protein [Tepiditoga spiralis]BBE30131.1 hypothetical protein OSSY52_02720 [Tepiditoga spiralis]
MNVGVIGYSGNKELEPVKSLKKICIEVGKVIAKNNWIMYNGGRDGIMDLVSEGAKKNGGKVIGVMPWEENGNEYLDLEIKTGLDFSMRSFVLLKSVDAVVSIGGEIGTALELVGAYAYKKPLILLKGTGGWTEIAEKILIDGKYLDNRKMIEVKVAKDLNEMEALLKEIEGELSD